MRLNRFLAKAGIASRRNADALIESGRVAVNGKAITLLGTQVDETKDRVEVDGKAARIIQEYIYILLNKPVSYLVTAADEFGRPTVLDLLGKYNKIVRPVGRLDLNSSGLLLLTNDGELAFRLTHPKFEIRKTYVVKCEGAVSDEKISKLEKGIKLETGLTAPAVIELVNRSDNFSRLQITIHEGRKRQIRLMFQAMGHRVISLKRILLGELALGDLPEGEFRRLEKKEIESLKRLVGL
jgi:23S rRNA pseudouridine2605 synthase